MANINISEAKYISSSYTGTKNGEGVGYGSNIKLASAAAKSDAINDATAAAGNNSGWSWAQGGSHTSNDRIGTSVGSASSPTYGTAWAQPSWNPETEPYVGYCTWSVAKPGNTTEVHLVIDISGLNANNIASASLKITYTGYSSSNYYICAFKSSATINNYYYTRGSNSLESTQATFKPTQNSSPITIDVTDVFKKAVTNNKNRLVIVSDAGIGDYNNYIIPSAFELTYVESTSACTAPTSVNHTNGDYIVPGQSITINWSGAGVGTNNAIAGYRIYWGTSSNFTPGNGVTGYYDFSSTAASGEKTFSTATSGTFPGVNNRGTTYYFKMCTKGTVKVDNAWYSSISSASTTLKVNTLPSVPTVTTDYNRLKSTGNTIVTFTVTPGSDNDQGQTYTNYYSDSSTGTKISCNNSFELTVTGPKTYYFWTKDGYEFSSNYTSITFTRNTPPTITSINVSNANQYNPSVNAGGALRKFVTRINASSVCTHDPKGSLTYNWYIKTGNIANTITWGNAISISNLEILDNIPVADKVGNFGKAYKVGLVVIDDLGESSNTVESNEIYIIPNPTISIINNNLGTSNIGDGNHFGRYIRIVQSAETSGITKNLLVYNNNNVILSYPFENGNINVDLDQCIRNNSYDFKVQYSCDGLVVNNITTKTLTRAGDIKPTITGYVQQHSTLPSDPDYKDGIHPYTDNYFSYNFITKNNSNPNIDSLFSNVYKIKLKFNDNELELVSTTPSDNSWKTNNVELTLSANLLNDNSLNIEKWIQLINGSGSSAPIGSINLGFIVTAYNIFGEFFPSDLYTIPFNFIEAFTFASNPILQLRMEGTNPKVYEQISVNTSHDYPLFEDEIIKFSCAINSIQSYINTTCYLQLLNSSTILKTITINSTDWTRISGNSYLYQLNILKEIEYLIPKITANANVDYKIKIVYNNNSYNNYYGESIFSSCKLIKIDTSSVNFSIENINETTNNSSKTITITYKFTNNGGGTGAYSAQSVQFKYSTNIMANINDYIDLGTAETLTVNQNSKSYSVPSTSIAGDILYIGAIVILTPAYQKINNKNPYKETSINTNHYQIVYINTNNNVIYRSTPNLLYGKNFFVINSSTPKLDNNLEVNDQLLVIRPHENRKKIYIGVNGNEGVLEIDVEKGLIIDGGSWD